MDVPASTAHLGIAGGFPSPVRRNIGNDFGGALITVVGVFGHQPRDNGNNPPRHARSDFGKQRRLLVSVLEDHRRRRIGLERQPAREHLIHQHAERVQIGTAIDRLPARLFGWDVIDRAHDDSGGGEGCTAIGALHQAEIGQERPVRFAIEQNVAGFHVAVNEIAIVGCFESG